MPTRLCSEPKCGNPATYRGRCATHAAIQERATHPNKHIYSSKRWRILRHRVLYHQPLCATDGCDEIAVAVDHIHAIEDGGQPWAITNLQGLCLRHHAIKTNQELRAR